MVAILILTMPRIACLALVKITCLHAVPPAEISTLVEAPVSVFYEAASKASPVFAVIAVVKARRNLVTADDRLSIPVSVYPSSASVVLRPIAVNPGVIRTRAWRNDGCIRRRRLIEAGAVSSEAYADRESGLSKHRTSSQKHHCQQFRFHKMSFLPAFFQCMARWPKLKCNRMRRILG